MQAMRTGRSVLAMVTPLVTLSVPPVSSFGGYGWMKDRLRIGPRRSRLKRTPQTEDGEDAMARIKIEDLEMKQEFSGGEMAQIRGGSA